jgi:pimeloyl-ACP methyl ester carboxylesterase
MERVLEFVAAPYYGVDADEIWRNASGDKHIAEAKVPLLVLHPEDDQIVKVDHARVLAEAGAGNENVRVWILPAGAHGLLETADAAWTQTVYRTFFERWARYAERPQLPGGGDAEVVYSGAESG